MRNFEFENRTKIVFGKGCENELLFELRKYGDKVMYVYGGPTIKKSGQSSSTRLMEAIIFSHKSNITAQVWQCVMKMAQVLWESL
mgnify:CR=1 FL=1